MASGSADGTGDPAGGRTRDGERSREAILDAAERMFARHGYDGARLADIAEAAGYSSTLPTYFFGDKSGLYESVIQRLFAQRDEALGALVQQATAELDDSPDGVRRGLEVLVGGYLEFLLDHPAFVSLMSRDALAQARTGRAPAPRHSKVFEEGLHRFLERATATNGLALDADQMLISIVALCFFPLEHDGTMISGMGYRARTRGFVERRTDHVVDLLMQVLGPEPGA